MVVREDDNESEVSIVLSTANFFKGLRESPSSLWMLVWSFTQPLRDKYVLLFLVQEPLYWRNCWGYWKLVFCKNLAMFASSVLSAFSPLSWFCLLSPPSREGRKPHHGITVLMGHFRCSSGTLFKIQDIAQAPKIAALLVVNDALCRIGLCLFAELMLRNCALRCFHHLHINFCLFKIQKWGKALT